MSPNHLMSLSPKVTPRAARRIAAACGVGVLLVGTAACGTSGATTPTNAGQKSGPETSQNGGTSGNGGQGQMPGANGKVAAVTGSTAQVQGTDGQVAVTWNPTTTFTKQVTASLSDVKVGTCVVVQSADDTSTGTPTTAPTKVTATTVRITTKGADGTCAGAFGGGGRPQFSGNGQPPAGGVPGGAATGAPRARGGSGGGAVGEVTAISASGFTVRSSVPDFSGGAPSAGSTPTTTTTDVAVTVNSSTTYTTTGTGAASDVKVGSCLRAQGTTDGTGAVSAKTVDLSAAVDGECSTGFRRSTAGDSSQES